MSKRASPVPPAQEGEGDTQPPSEEDTAPTLSAFEQLAEVWGELDTLEQQRSKVGELFGLEDGPPHSMQAMLTDECFGHIYFLSKEQGLNHAQTEQAYNIFTEVKRQCVEGVSLADNFAYFKNAVMDNSTLRKSMADVIAAEEAEEAAARAADAEAIAAAAAAEEAAAAEAAKKSKGGKSARKKGEPEPEPEPEPVVEKKERLTQLFSPEDVKNISLYAANGVFAHYTLTRATYNVDVFNNSIEHITEPVRVESVCADGWSLEDAIDLDAVAVEEEAERAAIAAQIAEAEAEERRRNANSGLDLLVNEKLTSTMRDLQDKLGSTEKNLGERLDAIIAN